MPIAVNAAGRLDRLPISRFHWKMLWLIGGGCDGSWCCAS